MACGHAERSYETLKRSIAIFEAFGDKRGLANNYTNLTAAAIAQGKLEEAEHYTELAIQYEKECGTVGLNEADYINRTLIEAITRAIVERPLGPD
jgi:tetratricopeptide (TPR) repeat protein